MKTYTLPLLLAAALPAGAQATAARVSPAERKAAAQIRAESLRADIRFLASDALEGRGPGSRGDELARLYIATRMEALGLEPAGTDGSYFQPFDIVGIRSRLTAPPVVTKGSQRLELGTKDAILFAGTDAPEARVSGAEVVFVGYGIVAPEFEWDDYKGADLKGKVLVFMNNDPEDDPRLFGGKTRLYYGRYDYKYEQAAKQGAAAAIIIHTEASAGYKWQVVETGWSGENFRLPGSTRPRVPIQAWITEDATRRLFSLAGQDLDALRGAAQRRDFKPVALGVTLDVALRTETRRQQTANVVGRLTGSDPVLAAEAVLYTAHHDHLGRRSDAAPGEDAIYNGAHDNASGVAQMLAVAEAMKALPRAPMRSVIFAAVGVEEQGLLGSEYLAAHPPVPPGRLAANINIDGIQIFGRTRDLTMVGLGKSNLDDRIKALAAMQGRVVVPDQFPDKGFFYRSDQFNLARIGVPAAYFDNGTDVIGKPAGWGKERLAEYESEHYHQVSDELRPEWNFDGAIEDGQLCFYLGVQVANAQRLPAWKPGDEFEAARSKALAEAGPLKPAAPSTRR
jgi:Zn-dependent M28 family amino/carboxypeptidase